VPELAAPPFLHVTSFFIIKRCFVCRVRRENQISIGRPDNLKLQRAKSQTEVDVVEMIWEVGCIEAAEPFENALPHGETGGRDRRQVLLQQGAIEIARVTSRKSKKGRGGNSAES